jgi:hypothetical protein
MKITFHAFSMGDVDDVEIYAAQPIYEWQQSDHGRWVMEHASDLRFYQHADPHTFGHRITIQGELEDAKATEYFLRWNNIES